METSIDFKLHGQQSADWHTHPVGSSDGFSNQDYQRAGLRFLSYKRAPWQETTLKSFDGRTAWSKFGHLPQARNMSDEFAKGYVSCIKGGDC
jgi:hypothetical protein